MELLANIPGIQTALLTVAALTFAWCFIFTATYAAFRLAQRPRRMKRGKKDAAARFPEAWSSEPKQRWAFGSEHQHDRFGDLSIKRAPGPRDWEPRT